MNTYQLFASVTRERVEPQIELRAGDVLVPYHLWHKPGDPARPPGFVAPHQPRVDFQLWFYGLAWDRREPAWVAGLVEGLCRRPRALQALFRAPLPPAPQAVRLSYLRYRFTSRDERRASGRTWRANLLGTSPEISCDRYRLPSP